MRLSPYINNSLHFNALTGNVKRWIILAIMGLLISFYPFKAIAQFIKIDIDVPAKTGLSNMDPIVLNQQPNFNSGMQEFGGTFAITISSSENLYIIASLVHSDSLYNDLGATIKFNTTLSFRNDGSNKSPKNDSGQLAVFPMSDSGKLLENMNGSLQLLNAYIFINANTEQAKFSNTTYYGDIKLTIEYI